MRLLLEQMLTLDEFEVVGSAANGAAALSEMNGVDPDVVVLDYNMPGLDGLLTARLIKEERPDQAIVLYTAYLDAELEQKATQAGIALCVEKAEGILTLKRDFRRLPRTGVTNSVHSSGVSATAACRGAGTTQRLMIRRRRRGSTPRAFDIVRESGVDRQAD